MDKREAPAKEKIILPQNLQRKMKKFYLKSSIPKLARTRRNSKYRLILSKNWSGKHG